jgi:hypothetical protein
VAVNGAQPDHCAALKLAEGGVGFANVRLAVKAEMQNSRVIIFFIGDGFVFNKTLIQYYTILPLQETDFLAQW